MHSLFDLLAAQRRFVYLVVGLLSVAGLYAATKLPSAIYPELAFPRILIVSEGSALGARQMVFSVTRPIEEAISIVPGVIRVRSRSIRGGSEISVTFADNADMMLALQQVQARVNEVRPQLPTDLNITVERMTPSLFPILSYNLEGGDPGTLYDIARYQLKPLISRVPGVGRVDVQGSDIREVEVVADPTRLASQRLTYDDLANAIKQATGVNAVGRVAQDYKQYLIVSAQEAHTPDDIANVVVGKGLRVRDIATVTLGSVDHVMIISGDGKPAALLNITRQPGGNTLAIVDSVASLAAAVRKTLPAGATLKPVYDQGALVRDAMASVRDAMIIGAVLAVIILLLFLHHARITAISASSIPLTLAISVFAMYMLGQTFNLMTLGAMAIAIGLVIDDSVVITENIVRHLRLTNNRHEAIRQAVQELIWPVTTSTITTVVVFLPLRLLTGVVGQFFAALSITLTIAVLVSLLLALSIIPLMADQFLREKDTDHDSPRTDSAGNAGRKPGVLSRVKESLDALSTRYQRSLEKVLHHPRRMLIAGAILIIAGVLAQRFVGTGFLPLMDEGAFVLDYFTPGGTALAETDRQLHIVERILANTPEIVATSRRTGAELGLFATEQNTGDIVARLTPQSQRSRTIFEVIDEVRGKVNAAVPRLQIEFVQILSDVINDLAGAASPIEIKMFGPDLARLEAYAESIEPKLTEVGGLVDLFNGVSEPTAELAMRVNGAEANRVGLTAEQISISAMGALLGSPAGEVRLEDRAIGVRVRAPDSVRYNPNRLRTLPIVSPQTGATVPLGTLADFQPTETRAQLLREDQQQMIAVTADVSDRSLGAVVNDVKQVLAANRPPSGVRIEIGGQYASQQEAFRGFLVVLALAVACVVTVMVLQFRSFIEPFVVLLAAPLSFVGAMGLLLLTGTPLNVSSFMGLILLVGLIVKNGIILLDFTHHRMQTEGVPLDRALVEAGGVRLRPILMTTLCTLFGLLPLSLGLGAGSEMQRPLALAVIGGLTLSTPITLYVVPTLLVAIRGRDYRLPIEHFRHQPRR
ncbi:MAG TPA: efflux RND transporter permease subunit [Gemmatimonadaceae bacterium]|nr:efflux RND transporter permease subunit [Gemmatimonadaceae bacterium]